MSRNTLLPLQGELQKNTYKPRALPWAKSLLTFQAALWLCFVTFFLFLSQPVKAQNNREYLVRVAINGGWTIKTGKTPDAYPIYYKDYLYNVRQGFSADVNAQFSLNKVFAIGLYYDFFRKHHSMPLVYTEGEQTFMYTIDNTYTIDFLAFSLGIQKSEGRSRYMLHYLIGIMDYWESGNYSPYDKFVTNASVGHCFGQGVMLNYDYMFNEHVAIGVELTYCIGTITKWKDPITLNRLSPKIGLRYYF